MVSNYTNFKFEQTLEKYIFTDNISDKEFESYLNNTIFKLNEGEKFDKWKDSMSQKLASGVLKVWDMVKKIKSGGINIIKKMMKACWSIIKALAKWCDKNKGICVFIIIVIIMITVGATSSYAAANPTDPNIPELANAALGFIDKFSDQLVDGGHHESTLQIAKSILTEIRSGGDNIDYSQISKEGQAIANTCMKMANDMKDSDPDKYSELIDLGSKISSQFTYIVNGLKTVIGG